MSVYSEYLGPTGQKKAGYDSVSISDAAEKAIESLGCLDTKEAKWLQRHLGFIRDECRAYTVSESKVGE